MKKTVIKRRKRVPAAGVAGGAGGGAGGVGRMSDQAAAEALVAVGRLGVGGGGPGGDDSEGDAEQPKKKRAKKAKGGDKEKGRGDDDAVMDMGDEPLERGRETQRKRSGDSTGVGWAEGGHPGPSSPQHQQRTPSMTHMQNPDGGLDSRYAHLQRGSSFAGSPHSHGGFDLPPLNAALGGGPGDAGAGGGGGGRGFGGFMGGGNNRDPGHFAGTPSSYMRSGSSAPSRTHSPLGPAGVGAGAGYVLPPPHGMGHSQYYPGTGMSPPTSVQHEAGGTSSMMGLGGSGGVPSATELERHYFELHEQKRRLEEMLEKTDRLMVGVKRGIDEMRTGQQPQPQQGQSQSQTPSQGIGGGAVPLIRGSGTDKERSRETVWPVVEPASRE